MRGGGVDERLQRIRLRGGKRQVHPREVLVLAVAKVP